MKWNLYLGCADCHLWKSKEFANVGKLLTRQALLFSHKRGLLISRRNFCHPPEAFCCFLAKTSNIRGKLFPIFALNFSPKRLSSMACFSSRQNSCHPRDAFSLLSLLISRQNFCRSRRALCCFGTKTYHPSRQLSKQAISTFSVLNVTVSLSLLSRSPWLGTPLVRTSMETGGPFSPLTPWRRQTPCVHELVSWLKVNSSESLFWIS